MERARHHAGMMTLGVTEVIVLNYLCSSAKNVIDFTSRDVFILSDIFTMATPCLQCSHVHLDCN